MALPGYLEDTAKDFAKQATATYSVPIDTSKFTGQQFVAGEDPLQTQAIGLATQGVGSYAPYLTAAQQAITAQGGLTGAQAYQPFMSPYQTDVIDETLRQYDLSRTAGQQAIRDAAVGTGGFGGGREGAMLGQYDADTLANREGLRAQMLQSGLQQAQQQQQALQLQQEQQLYRLVALIFFVYNFELPDLLDCDYLPLAVIRLLNFLVFVLDQ